MWSKFRRIYSQEKDYITAIYLECNSTCARMFLEKIYNDCYMEYKYLNDTPPAIENVKQYITASDYIVRVITLEELQELGFISKCEHSVNLLVCNHDCPEHMDLNSTPF